MDLSLIYHANTILNTSRYEDLASQMPHRNPIGYYKRGGRTHPIHARTRVQKVSIPVPSKGNTKIVIMRRNSPVSIQEIESSRVHPSFRHAIPDTRPVLTTGQALPQAVRQHLSAVSRAGFEEARIHLRSFHGIDLPTRKFISPEEQISGRFKPEEVQDRTLEDLERSHLNQHLEERLDLPRRIFKETPTKDLAVVEPLQKGRTYTVEEADNPLFIEFGGEKKRYHLALGRTKE